MKTKERAIVDYNEKKFLNRLFLLASSKEKAKCLLQYNRNGKLDYSRKFYHLLLECFQNWGILYGKTHPKYLNYYNELRRRKRIPVEEKFFNHPEDIVFRREEEDEYLDLKRDLQNLNDIRENFLRKLSQNDNAKLKTKEIENLMMFYTEEHDKIENNPKKNKLLQQDNKEDNDVFRDQLMNEMFFFQDFNDSYKEAEDKSTTKRFYNDVKVLSNQYFNIKIDFEAPLDAIDRGDREVVDEKKEQIKIEPLERELNQVKENFEYPDYPLDKEDYEVKIDLIENDDEIKELNLNNSVLENDVSQLAKKKRDLERKIERLEREQKENKTPRKNINNKISSDNEGLMNIMKNKDLQISNMQYKIDRLEKEYKKIDEPDLNYDFDLKTPKKTKTKARQRSSRREKSATYLKNSRLLSQYSKTPKKRHIKKYENSGTQFVDKMYSDINRLLNKTRNRNQFRDGYIH